MVSKVGAPTNSGAAGEDIVLRMPVGTIIRNYETGEIMMELLEHGEQRMLAKGR